MFAVLGLMGNPFLILIAVFIFMAAAGEARYVQARELTRGRAVTDAMITPFEALGVMSTADDAAALLLRTTQQEFPVLDGASRLRGVLTRQAIIAALRDDGGARPVLEMMTTDVAMIAPDTPLDIAVERLQRSPARFVGVVDAEGKLVGYVTPESIGALIKIRSSREKRSPGWLRG